MLLRSTAEHSTQAMFQAVKCRVCYVLLSLRQVVQCAAYSESVRAGRAAFFLTSAARTLSGKPQQVPKQAVQQCQCRPALHPKEPCCKARCNRLEGRWSTLLRDPDRCPALCRVCGLTRLSLCPTVLHDSATSKIKFCSPSLGRK